MGGLRFGIRLSLGDGGRVELAHTDPNVGGAAQLDATWGLKPTGPRISDEAPLAKKMDREAEWEVDWASVHGHLAKSKDL